MQFTYAAILALCDLTIAGTLPRSEPEIHTGFTIPNNGVNGLYQHVVDPDTGAVTTTYLGDPFSSENATSEDDGALHRRLANTPAWPSSGTQVSCYGQGYSPNHVSVAAGQLGNWCKTNTLKENTNFSYTNYDVAVFVCNWAQTITNDCSSGQINSALSQSAKACGSGVTTSNAYFPWYKAYGIATPGTYVCNQVDGFSPV